MAGKPPTPGFTTPHKMSGSGAGSELVAGTALPSVRTASKGNGNSLVSSGDSTAQCPIQPAKATASSVAGTALPNVQYSQQRQ